MSHEQSKKHQLLLERVTSSQSDPQNSESLLGKQQQGLPHHDIISSSSGSNNAANTNLPFGNTQITGTGTDFLWSKALLSALGSLNGTANTNLHSAQNQTSDNFNPKNLDNFLNSFNYNGLNLSRFTDSSPSLDQQNSLYSQNSPGSSTNHSSASPRPNYKKSCDDTTFCSDNNSDGLTKIQLRQALIHLINRDDEFISSLHQAYCDSLQDRMKIVNSLTLPASVNTSLPVTTTNSNMSPEES